MKCYLCDTPLKTGKRQCLSCRAWNWGGVSAASRRDETVLFEDIKNADDTRITTHLLDANLGGGLVTTAVVLLGGLPGAGKSTLLLQLCAMFCNHGLQCIYIAGEEGLPAIKARGVRLGIKTHGLLRFIPAIGGLGDLGDLLMYHRPKAVILDSIDALVGHNAELEIKFLEILGKYAVELEAPIFVISQVNKDADFSGLMAKQHAVDCLLTMMPDEDIKTENGEAIRIVETIKNRHGRAFVTTAFEMTACGLQPVDLGDTEAASETAV